MFTVGASTADAGSLFQWVTTRWVKLFFLIFRCTRICRFWIFIPWPRRLTLSSFILNNLVLFISLKPCIILNTCIMSPRSHLNAKVGRFNCSSLDLYGRSFRCGTILVALLCTFSILLISFFNIGFHTEFPYSRCGLIRALSDPSQFRMIDLIAFITC